MTPSKPEPVSTGSESDLAGVDSQRAQSDASRRSQQAMRDSFSNRTSRHGSQPAPADADEASPGYGGNGYPPEAPEGEAAHLLDYVRVLYRRRYVATTAFILVVVLVTVYTFTRTPIYQASVQMEIDYASPKVVPFQQVTDSQSGGYDAQEYYQTQYKILQSRSLARRALDSANLWKNPLLLRAAAVGGVTSSSVGRRNSGCRAGL